MAVEPISSPEIPHRWRFPWVRLAGGIGVASDPKKLMLAALGLVLLHLGWEGLDRLFPRSSHITPEAEPTLRWPMILPWPLPLPDVAPAAPGRPVVDLGSESWRLTEPARLLMAPFLAAFRVEDDAATFLHAALAAVWGAVVWGLIGGAIARIAVVQVARSERVGMAAALRFTGRKWFPLIGTPLYPLLGIAIFVVLCALFGLLYRLPIALAPIVAGLFAFLPLLAGLVMTIIVIGLAVGWPLMHASVAAEDEDSFDALSRSYAYVHQRPWHYAGALLLIWLVGSVGLIVVDVFAGLVVHLAHWGLSFGAGRAALVGLIPPGAAAVHPLARDLHAFWLGVVGLLAHGWIYSYFWTSATLIYLSLRHDVDGTAWHDVAVSEPETHPLASDTEPKVPAGDESGTPAEPSVAEGHTQ